MRRLTSLAVAVLVLGAPAPALASKRTAWKRVLRSHHASAATSSIRVRAGHVGRRTVSVRIAAPAADPAPVLFPDPLFGATAWRWKDRRWTRIDAAEVRPSVVQQLDPGAHAFVRLPLRRRPARIRVLVPVTAERAGAWVDVTR